MTRHIITSEIKNRIVAEGKADYKTSKANPYRKNTLKYHLWRSGWLNGQQSTKDYKT